MTIVTITAVTMIESASMVKRSFPSLRRRSTRRLRARWTACLRSRSRRSMDSAASSRKASSNWARD